MQRIVAFDTETTGTNPETARIVEIALAQLGGPARTFRVDPGVPIPPEATAIHEITDPDVAGKPRFRDVASEIQSIVEGAVLVGYNSRSFDTPLLNAELRRAGERGLDLDATTEIDVFRIWQAVEPRTLQGAARRWLGEDHAGAHDAAADVEATLRVWTAIKMAYDLDDDACARLTRPTNEIDRAGKFALDAAGNVVLTFGKHRGKPVRSVDPSYFEWMMNGEFPPSTKSLIARLLLHGYDLPEAAAFRASLAAGEATQAP